MNWPLSVLSSQASVQTFLRGNLHSVTAISYMIHLKTHSVEKIPVFLCTGGQDRGSRIDGSFSTACDWRNEEWKVAKTREFNTYFMAIATMFGS